mgnify:CR=1 FL=1
MESQFKKWGITDYTRISVDKYSAKNYDDWKHRLITEYPPAKYDHPKNMSMLFNQFNTLIDWYNSNKSEHCIIMEDDLCLDSMKYWNFDWDYLMENLPCNWDCIQLYASSFNKLNLNLTRRHNGCHGSACFMVTRHYVEKLIKMFCYEDKYKIQYNYGYDGGAEWNTFSKIQPTSPDFVPYNIGITYTFPIFTINTDLKIPQVNEDIGIAIVGFIGGFGGVCCGILFLIIGGIMALTMNDNKQQVMYAPQANNMMIANQGMVQPSTYTNPDHMAAPMTTHMSAPSFDEPNKGGL